MRSWSASGELLLLGGEFSHLQNNSENVHQILLRRYFREELQQRMWGRPVCRRPHGVLLSYIIIMALFSVENVDQRGGGRQIYTCNSSEEKALDAFSKVCVVC